MTSNIGAHLIANGVSSDGTITDETRDAVMGELKSHFRPEFLNRVDDTILFKPLGLEEVEEIVKLTIEHVRKRLADRKVELDVSPGAISVIAKNSYDPVYGARPVKRYVQRHLETSIAKELIRGEVGDGGKVTVENHGNELAIRV